LGVWVSGVVIGCPRSESYLTNGGAVPYLA
jgi:hypothetical protein